MHQNVCYLQKQTFKHFTIVFKVLVFIFPGCSLSQSDNKLPTDAYGTNTHNQVLDSSIIKINNEITYGLYVFNDNTYCLKVNNIDSVKIGPFYWDAVNSRGLVFENLQTHYSYLLNEDVCYLCLPHGMESYILIKIYKQNGIFKIDKNRNNWLTSESGYLVLTSQKTIVIPVIRGPETGIFEYWKYDEKSQKYILYQKKYIDKASSEGEVYDLKNIETIKKIIRMQ